MTVSIDNTSYIKLTFNDNTTATVIDLGFDWVVLKNQTQYDDGMILHLLQNWYERQSNKLCRHTGGYNG